MKKHLANLFASVVGCALISAPFLISILRSAA